MICDTAQYTFTMSAENVDLFVKTTSIKCVINFVVAEGGALTVDGEKTSSVTANKGSKISLQATPDEHYKFLGYVIGGEIISTEEKYTYTVSRGGVEIYCDFGYKDYLLTVTKTDGGKFYINEDNVSAGLFTYNNMVKLTAEPLDGYCFDGWYKGDVLLSSDIDYLYCMQAENNVACRFSHTQKIVSKSYVSGNFQLVEISIKNNPGIISLRFYVRFNSSEMLYESYSSSGLLRNPTPIDPNANKGEFIVRFADMNNNVTADGLVITLKFELLNSQENGYEIEFIESRNQDGQSILFSVQ